MSTGDVTAATAKMRQRMVGRTGIAAQATTSSAIRSRYHVRSPLLWSDSIVNGSVATANGGE